MGMTTDKRPRPRPALILAFFLILASLAGPLHASASPYPQGVVEGVESWLDRALPTDAAPGSTIRVGATIWSTRDDGPISGSSVFFRLYGATGDEFAEVVATEDWKGHFTATLVVPPGGVGELHIGTQGTACDANGCTRSDAIYEVAGVGPPPAAPLPAIATAAIRVETADPVAGVPTVLTIVLGARADWDPATVPDPAELRLIVREPRGPDLDVVTAVRTSPGVFEATVTFPDPGEYALQAAADASGDPDSLFSTSTVLVTVAAPAAETPTPAPTSPPTTPPDEGSGALNPLVAALAIAVIGVGALLGLRRRRA